MKRPATASAGLTFLKQGMDIELAAAGVAAFLRYCERNNPGLALSITYVSNMAVIKPLITTAAVPITQDSRKAGLEKEGLPMADNFSRATLKAVG